MKFVIVEIKQFLLMFLLKNKKWLKLDEKEFYNFTLWVAQSRADLKDYVVMAIEKTIQTNLVSLSDGLKPKK